MHRDKAGHFTVGLAIAALTAWATGAPLLGLLAAVAAGIGKEAWDATGRGTVDLLDFVATAAGGVAVAIVWGMG